MAMSRKDYVEVAGIIKDTREVLDPSDATARAATFIIANRLATMFQIDNSRFDRDKFLEACGLVL